MAFADLKNDFVFRQIQQAREYGDARWAEGKAEGKVDAILAVLAARGLEVDHETRARITSCTDKDLLDRWIVQAATADDARTMVW